MHIAVVIAVARIALVKPDKARNIENMILAAAQRGQMMEKVRGAAVFLPSPNPPTYAAQEAPHFRVAPLLPFMLLL